MSVAPLPDAVSSTLEGMQGEEVAGGEGEGGGGEGLGGGGEGEGGGGDRTRVPAINSYITLAEPRRPERPAPTPLAPTPARYRP